MMQKNKEYKLCRGDRLATLLWIGVPETRSTRPFEEGA